MARHGVLRVYLLAVWLVEYDVTGEGAPASRLPAPVILGHVLFALTGVVFWVIHLPSGAGTQGWTAVGSWRSSPRWA